MEKSLKGGKKNVYPKLEEVFSLKLSSNQFLLTLWFVLKFLKTFMIKFITLLATFGGTTRTKEMVVLISEIITTKIFNSNKYNILKI